MQRYLCTRLTLAAILCCLAADKPLMAQFENAEDVAREMEQRREQLLLHHKQRIDALRLRQLAVEQQRVAIAGNLNFLRLKPPNGGSLTLKLVEIAGKPQFRIGVVRINGGQASHQLELSKENEDQIVRHFVSQCETYCNGVLQAANFDNEQLEKLKGAATLDAARLIRRMRADFSGTTEEQQAREFNPLQAYANANNELKLGITSPQSLFQKVLRTVLTSEQCSDLFRWRVGRLCEAVNRNANLSLDDQVRKLGLSYPKPRVEGKWLMPLLPEQQAALLKLIVDNHSDPVDLLEPSNRIQSSSLLKNISADQLSEFLSPAQVQAVLRENETLVDMRFQRLTMPQQDFQFPARLIPTQIPVQNR